MATISSPGLGSGLDVNSLITKLMQVESQPVLALNTKEASYQAKLSAFGTLKGTLSALQTAAEALTSSSTFTAMSAASSDSSVLTAAADSTAAAGTYEIAVSKLAKAHVVHTNVDYGTDTFDSGTLRITIGTGTPVDIALAATSTLSDIRDAINDANAGVTAAIINDGAADRLVLTSETTGNDGAITLEAPTSNNDGTRRLTDLIGANLTVDRAAENAELTINGFAISRSSNTITDALEGVTLTLTKADLATPETSTVTISENTAAVTSAVNAFVKAYNDAVGQIKTLSAYDATNKKSAVLTGDGTARTIQSQLTTMVHASITGVAGGISRLSDIGITVQKGGTLEVDSSVLSDALADSDIDIATFFTSTTSGNTGIAVRFDAMLESLVESDGLIDSRTEGISASIKDLGKRREALQRRLESIEKRYRAQYSALDSLVASMNSTSSYLAQQLANLPSISSN